MIIFYDKKTGEVKGTVDGRIHPPEHLKIWAGDKKKVNRLVIQWKPIKVYKDKKGVPIAVDFVPDHPQKKIFGELDKKSMKVYEYRVDVKTKRLVKKRLTKKSKS